MTALSPTPVPWMAEAPYAVPRHPAPITLRLDGNEGAPPSPRVLESLKYAHTRVAAAVSQPETPRDRTGSSLWLLTGLSPRDRWG